VDVRHEVILAWHITAATESDAGQIPELVKQAQDNLPEAYRQLTFWKLGFSMGF
jgi:hypothetical protein